MQNFAWRFPSSVKILTCQRASIITVDYAIRVEYRDNFENEMVSKSFGFWTIARQVLYHSIHHPRGIALPRMHSCTDKYSFFGHGFGTFGIFVFAGDGEEFTFVAGQSPGEEALMKKVLGVWILLNSLKIFLQIAVGVWEAVSKELLIVVILKRVSEREGVIATEESAHIPLVIIGVVVDLFANPVPPSAFLLLLLVGEAQDFHAVIVEGVWFRQIQNVELYFLALRGVRATEEIPLSISIGVYVVLEH